VTSLLKLIDELDTEEALFNTRIAERLQGHAGYRAIQQLPGIGTILAAILVAEIGDIHRFASPDPEMGAPGGADGLDPVHQPAGLGRRRLGSAGVTRTGRTWRTLEAPRR
jgi:transposase